MPQERTNLDTLGRALAVLTYFALQLASFTIRFWPASVSRDWRSTLMGGVKSSKDVRNRIQGMLSVT